MNVFITLICILVTDVNARWPVIADPRLHRSVDLIRTHASPPALPTKVSLTSKPMGPIPANTKGSIDVGIGNYSRCGIRGSSLEGLPYINDERSDVQPHELDPFDGAVTSMEWDVPILNETLFYAYTGTVMGLRPHLFQGPIAAGVREFPWQVALIVNGKFLCSASLVSNDHVLTAAHCVNSYKSNPSVINLSIGDWDLSTSLDNQEGSPSIQTSAIRVTVHPDFSKYTLRNDVAVLRLAERVEYSSNIRAICLPKSDMNTIDRIATTSGWKMLSPYRRLDPYLQLNEGLIIDNIKCDKRWNRAGAPRGFILKSMMCIDHVLGDSCNTDSGGPSIYEHPSGSGNYVQIGIESFNFGSCINNPGTPLPVIHTSVSHHLSWIEQQLY